MCFDIKVTEGRYIGKWKGQCASISFNLFCFRLGFVKIEKFYNNMGRMSLS